MLYYISIDILHTTCLPKYDFRTQFDQQEAINKYGVHVISHY